ncbi:protein of unknown function [Nocardioides terrae]|uniref:DUF4307 domain-containing protein n=1 Tax=Nocardioides terrae TaxID=574651 RepID=A0A1I1DXH4_9ACTN|nr:DUF4307 domain-containing protein [Nocardioides terrae]SFB79769.1 protein of unknown function [Nocardioides terrae]
MTQQDPRIAQRYAAQGSVWPKVFIVAGLAVVLLLAVWLAWAVWVHSTPRVTSSLTTFDVVDEHSVTAEVQVDLRSDAENASCLVRAYAEDHTVVGDVSFEPKDGTNDVTIRTERRATSVDRIGCTADGQNDAR